jgi:hypothetical protein
MKPIRPFLALCALLFFSPDVFAQYALIYSINANGTGSLLGYTGAPVNLVVPSFITNIGNDAFLNCSSLTSVIFDNQLAGIGNDAFNACTNLTNVTFPNSLTSIGEGAFDDCISMTQIIVPDSVTSIGEYAFADETGLTNAVIGNGVTSLPYQAFNFCPALVSITIGRNVTSIGEIAFWSCTSLSNVLFTGNAPSVGEYAFDWWTLYTQGLDPAIVYYVPGTTGWSAFSTATYLPAVLWNPQIQPNSARGNNPFSFTITGTANIPIVVRATTNISSGAWTPLHSCTLTNGSVSFSDPNNCPARFYSIAFP